MKLKTSCFNKTIWLKNVTHFWPIWAGYLAVLLVQMPVSLMLSVRPAERDTSGMTAEVFGLTRLFNHIDGSLSPMVLFFAAVISALAVFSYLFSARSCNMMHAFPLSRSALFWTNYSSGFLFLLIPQIITFFVSFFVCVLSNISSVEYLLYWLLATAGMSFLFYTLAVFCCVISGSLLAAGAWFFIGNVLYLALKEIATMLLTMLCYGFGSLNGTLMSQAYQVYNWSRDTALSPLMYLYHHVSLSWEVNDYSTEITSVEFDGGLLIGLYCISAFGVLILSFVFYKKRHLECAGNIIAFSWLRPFFRWGTALCGGFCLNLLLLSILLDTSDYTVRFWQVFFGLFPCTFLCFFVAEMLLNKQFRVFRRQRLAEWGICVGSALLLTTLVHTDAFYLERRVPDANKVAAVELYCDYDIVLDEEAQIESACQLQRTIISQKAEYENLLKQSTEIDSSGNSDLSFCEVEFSYYLKNGQEMLRKYTIPVSEELLADADTPCAQMKQIEKDSHGYLRSQICDNFEDVTFTDGYFATYDQETGASIQTSFTKEQTEQIYAALLQDIEEGNYPNGIESFTSAPAEHMLSDSLYFYGEAAENKSIYDRLLNNRTVEIETSDTSLAYMEIGTASTENNKGVVFVDAYFQLYDTCTHTIQALTDLGIITDESDLTLNSDADYNYG